MTDSIEPAPVWKRGVAATLDFFTAFFVLGWVVGRLSGQTTKNGFILTGGPAIALFVLIVAYFFIGRHYAGGTLWDRILRIGRPQPRA